MQSGSSQWKAIIGGVTIAVYAVVCCMQENQMGTAQQGRATTNVRYREEEIPRNIAVNIIQTTPKNESGYMSLKSRCTQSVTSTYVIVCAQEAWAQMIRTSRHVMRVEFLALILAGQIPHVLPQFQK